jgi:hypothetical protein
VKLLDMLDFHLKSRGQWHVEFFIIHYRRI